MDLLYAIGSIAAVLNLALNLYVKVKRKPVTPAPLTAQSGTVYTSQFPSR